MYTKPWFQTTLYTNSLFAVVLSNTWLEKFNDHTLVYEWNEVHSDEPSLIVNGDYSKEVSHGLQEIRVAAGLTQQELADLSGVNIRQIQKFEKGESQLQNATVETALKLADALGVDVHRLLEKS